MYMPAFEKLEKADKEGVLKIIRSTKQKLGWLRKKMEHPDYNNCETMVSPSDLVVYKCERDFLNLAITKYIKLGGEYKEPKISIRDTKFNDRLEDISKITFYNGGFFSTDVKIVVDLLGDKPRFSSGTFNGLNEKETDIEKEDFLYHLGELHMGEWRCHYSPERFGIVVCDGEEWVLKIEYKDGRKKTFSGMNAYPYNFDALLELLCL